MANRPVGYGYTAETTKKVKLRFKKFKKQPPEVLCKKGVLKNFAQFTGKHLCQSLFFNKLAGLWLAGLNLIKKQKFSLLCCSLQFFWVNRPF